VQVEQRQPRRYLDRVPWIGTQPASAMRRQYSIVPASRCHDAWLRHQRSESTTLSQSGTLHFIIIPSL